MEKGEWIRGEPSSSTSIDVGWGAPRCKQIVLAVHCKAPCIPLTQTHTQEKERSSNCLKLEGVLKMLLACGHCGRSGVCLGGSYKTRAVDELRALRIGFLRVRGT